MKTIITYRPFGIQAGEIISYRLPENRKLIRFLCKLMFIRDPQRTIEAIVVKVSGNQMELSEL